MDQSRVVNLAREFSRFPAGRYLTDGPASGQQFRGDVLVPALRSTAEKVVVELDGTLGFGSSFLEEAFGGLVRECGFTSEHLRRTLVLMSSDSSLEAEIWDYIDRAKPKKSS
jgi:hypothetical protein